MIEGLIDRRHQLFVVLKVLVIGVMSHNIVHSFNGRLWTSKGLWRSLRAKISARCYESRHIGRLLLRFAPQILDRIIVRRVGGQLADRDTITMLLKELACGFAGMILGSVLDEKHRLTGLGHDLLDEGLVTGTVEPTVLTLIKQPSRKVLNEAEDFVALALAGRLDRGLLALIRPGPAQRPPLRKADLILHNCFFCILVSFAGRPPP